MELGGGTDWTSYGFFRITLLVVQILAAIAAEFLIFELPRLKKRDENEGGKL